MGSLKSSQAELEQGLTTIGFLRGNMIYPEDWSLYLKEKNEIRSTWHKNNQLKIQQEFYQLILTTQFQTLSIFERVRKFRRFLSVWSGDLGAAPFIKGLKRMLETQFTKDFLFTWSLLDDTLTQAGPEFMRDSVTLLLSVFGFTQYVDLENAGRGEGDGDQAGVVRVWQMNDDMSDIQLDRLLSLFPNERSLPGRMSGNIQVGSTRRAAELVIKSTLLKYLIHWPGRWILWVAQLFSDLQHGSG
ncbi:hypothetical protein K7432_015594 [Basidiobolus ranarum]|uniref:Uncharacterized protein n=1 Tax=Basidiobolus ranarum TaxID=34480 RepID=A0ABR2VMW4_9FUNG